MADAFFSHPVDTDASIPTQAEAFEACARIRRTQYEATLEIIDNTGRTQQAACEMIDDTLARAQVGIDQSPGRTGAPAGPAALSAAIRTSRFIRSTRSAWPIISSGRYRASNSRSLKSDCAIACRAKRPMTVDERKQANLPCALLAEDNTCSVYAARPLICRGYSSLSVEKCEEAYLNPAGTNTAPFDYHARIWTVSVADGMRDAQKAKGIDAQRYELNSAVLCAIATPNVAEKWLQGQDVFRDCLIDKVGQAPRPPAAATARPALASAGRNDPCPCGSGKKYKKCCLAKKTS